MSAKMKKTEIARDRILKMKTNGRIGREKRVTSEDKEIYTSTKAEKSWMKKYNFILYFFSLYVCMYFILLFGFLRQSLTNSSG